MPIIPTHPSWCESAECGPLHVDEPDGPILHSGARVVADFGPGGSVDLGLLKTDDKPTRVSVAGQNMTAGDARRLAGTLTALARLADES